MDIQSAIGECDIARAILIAMGSYKKTPSPNESILQSLTFAVESSLDRAKNAFSHKKDDTTKPNFTLYGADLPAPTDYIPYNIGNRIQMAREDLGMSEDDLAEKLNIHPGDVLTWEDGADQLPAEMIIPLANALKCDPMWLLCGNNANQAPPAPVNVMKGADLANIGVRIKNRRNETRMGVDNLAGAIDVPIHQIYQWETGKAIPHSGYYDRLAKALNTSVTWLMTGKDISGEFKNQHDENIPSPDLTNL